jgi:hypothetical protein
MTVRVVPPASTVFRRRWRLSGSQNTVYGDDPTGIGRTWRVVISTRISE